MKLALSVMVNAWVMSVSGQPANRISASVTKATA